jgi:hypothetical protein
MALWHGKREAEWIGGNDECTYFHGCVELMEFAFGSSSVYWCHGVTIHIPMLHTDLHLACCFDFRCLVYTRACDPDFAGRLYVQDDGRAFAQLLGVEAVAISRVDGYDGPNVPVYPRYLSLGSQQESGSQNLSMVSVG